MSAENWKFRHFYPLKVYLEGDENAKINDFSPQVPLPIHFLALFEVLSRCDDPDYYKKQIMWPFSMPLLPLLENVCQGTEAFGVTVLARACVEAGTGKLQFTEKREIMDGVMTFECVTATAGTGSNFVGKGCDLLLNHLLLKLSE